VAPRLVVVGSVNLDLVATAKRLPRPGETVGGATLDRIPGGKGANQALAAARLGADVALVACVGDDSFAREALRELRAAAVALEGLKVVAGPTGVALITVDESGENEIVVAPGANGRLEPEDVRLPPTDGLLVQLEIPLETVAAAVERADGFVCLNAAPAQALPPALVERCDLVVVNAYELKALGAAPRLTALTLGVEGAVLLEEGREVARASPPRVEAVDGTAAGDAFTACLAVSHLEGRPWDEALRRACAAGALAASRRGAQTSLPTAAEVDAIL
jgi:ribokinase